MSASERCSQRFSWVIHRSGLVVLIVIFWWVGGLGWRREGELWWWYDTSKVKLKLGDNVSSHASTGIIAERCSYSDPIIIIHLHAY